MKGVHRTFFAWMCLLAGGLLGFSPSTALAQRVQDLPQPTDYVNDFAHVLSPQTVAQLDNICSQLDHSQANAQIAVVTINSLDGEDPADYANELEGKWKMGRKGSDRGLLVLLAVNDHKYRIEPGYGLEGILPDGKVGDIGRSMIPYLRAKDYNSAVSLAVGQVAQVIAADAHITLENQPVAPQPVPQGHKPAAGQVILLILLLIFFGGFFLLRLLFSFGLFGGWGGGGPWFGGGPFIGGGGFGGGGFGGGGDSGGGGGFGGFGGGDFGGGGAGGDW